MPRVLSFDTGKLAQPRLQGIFIRITVVLVAPARLTTKVNPPLRALIIEDEKSIARFLRRILEEEGFAVDVEESGERGQELAFIYDYDVIVLDLGLPDRPGAAIIQSLRQERRNTPVLVLTGSAGVDTMVRTLDLGADDFITKPVDREAFKARVRALMRRGGATRTEQIAVANVVLNRLTRQVLVDGKELRLGPKEHALLEHFMLARGAVVTRSELLEKVWDLHFDPGTNVIDVNIGRLRRRLADAGAKLSVTSRRAVGFVLEAIPDSPKTD